MLNPAQPVEAQQSRGEGDCGTHVLRDARDSFFLHRRDEVWSYPLFLFLQAQERARLLKADAAQSYSNGRGGGVGFLVGFGLPREEARGGPLLGQQRHDLVNWQCLQVLSVHPVLHKKELTLQLIESGKTFSTGISPPC